MLRPACDGVENRRRLRFALGRFATGVAVVTTCDPSGEAVGLTVNSFTSVSLEPPLVLWSLNKRSRSLAAFSRAGRFAVNILAKHQRYIAERFCSDIHDRFCGLTYELGSLCVPILSGSVAWFQCTTMSKLRGGDHFVYIGRVVEFRYRNTPPLLYYCGEFGELEPGRRNKGKRRA